MGTLRGTQQIFKLPFIFQQQSLNILYSVAEVVSPRTKNKLDKTVSGSESWAFFTSVFAGLDMFFEAYKKCCKA